MPITYHDVAGAIIRKEVTAWPQASEYPWL